jgi:hypothetical protein
MNNFGTIKSKFLKKLTESYTKENKSDIKDLLTTVRKNKDFKQMYLFYEEIENKYIEDMDNAKLYVESVESILKNSDSMIKLETFCENLNEKLLDVEVEKNDLYESLDKLVQKDTLNNIEDKIHSKKYLYQFLTKKKQVEKSEKNIFTENEKLLGLLLTNNFNTLYGKTLAENDKKELKELLLISNDDLKIKVNELTESIDNQIDKLLVESNDDNFKNKLKQVKTEIKSKEVTRLNYYRLLELKNGLI